MRRRAGLARLAGLLEALRSFDVLREGRPGSFSRGTRPFLHFHYPADGRLVADVRLTGGFTPFDVSDEAGQQELLAVVERCLEG